LAVSNPGASGKSEAFNNSGVDSGPSSLTNSGAACVAFSNRRFISALPPGENRIVRTKVALPCKPRFDFA
jgi:hypothetical protein